MRRTRGGRCIVALNAVPTALIAAGEVGQLECLSIGDFACERAREDVCWGYGNDLVDGCTRFKGLARGGIVIFTSIIFEVGCSSYCCPIRSVYNPHSSAGRMQMSRSAAEASVCCRTPSLPARHRRRRRLLHWRRLEGERTVRTRTLLAPYCARESEDAEHPRWPRGTDGQDAEHPQRLRVSTALNALNTESFS